MKKNLFFLLVIFIIITYSLDKNDIHSEAESLIKNKIIPVIQQRPGLKLNISNLRLCYCSIQFGCDRMTSGWIPGILEGKLSESQRDRFYQVCVTDGDCYQSAVSGPSIPAYGCIDESKRAQEFHVMLGLESEHCKNKTHSPDSEELWICCAGDSYCANQTVLAPINFRPISPEPKKKVEKQRERKEKKEIGKEYTEDANIFEEENSTKIVSTKQSLWDFLKSNETTPKPNLIATNESSWTLFLFLKNNKLQLGFLFSIFLLVILPAIIVWQKQRVSAFTFRHFKWPLFAQNESFVAPSDCTSARSTVTTNIEVTEMSILNASTFNERADKEKKPNFENKRVAKLFKDLESTSGSGAGPLILQERTIAHQIKLIEKIGEGRFGMVFVGNWVGEQVAVKVFKSSDEAAYNKEVHIYETRMLRHPNVLRFIGSDRIDHGSSVDNWLVTEYHSNGSLHQFLVRNVINLQTCYELIRSAINGLAFLHTDISGLQNSAKPGIAHRDIKSKNIMVKNDMTCAIGDFGLSVSADRDMNELEKDNLKCGTVRYLAPEILAGTLQGGNLFEGFLMADMYSFSLVMWEILARSEDDDIVACSPEEAVPYIEYTTRDPSFENMYQIVHVNKFRPKLNNKWKTNPTFKIIYSIIRDCWNANPTARLNAIQVRLRLERQHETILSAFSEFLHRSSSKNSPEKDEIKKESSINHKKNNASDESLLEENKNLLENAD